MNALVNLFGEAERLHQSQLPPAANKFHIGNGDDGKHYWLTPPDLYADLNIRLVLTPLAKRLYEQEPIYAQRAIRLEWGWLSTDQRERYYRLARVTQTPSGAKL